MTQLTDRHRIPPRAGAPAPLRVAVAGAGKMGLHHLRAIARLSPLATVTAVADPSPAAPTAVRAVAPGAKVYPSLTELLASERVDVVHVCTAPSTHEALAAQAIEAECDVYIEKPVAESVRSVERLFALANARGVRICAGHQLLFEPPARQAIALLPAVGEVAHVESYFSFRTVRRAIGGRAPMRADLQLLDILPHPVYLLLTVLEAAQPHADTEIAAIEVGPGGTVHALVRRGPLTATLVVTLDGRPVESYLRVVGRNGSIYADFVRGTVQRLLGPGTSGIDKALSPYRVARQLIGGTTSALVRRVAHRQHSYPGLAEIFEAFYQSVRGTGPVPMSQESILQTTRLWERIRDALQSTGTKAPSTQRPSEGPVALVTGGTGFLGKKVVRSLLARGVGVRVLARRTPVRWECEPGVEYIAGDVSDALPAAALEDVDVIVHCAAETSGGWEEHERNSLGATERVIRAAASGPRRVVHVSSLAVLGESGDAPVNEQTPLDANARARGPYVWGKLESERLAQRLSKDLGVELRTVRPGALTDERQFEPPGRLGKRLGNIFVAVGSPRSELGVVDVAFAGRVIAWIAANFDTAPPVLNLLSPRLPTRGALVARLRRANPDLTVVPLPMAVLRVLSAAALVAQRLLRPSRPAVNVARVFGSPRFDTALITSLVPRLEREPTVERETATV